MDTAEVVLPPDGEQQELLILSMDIDPDGHAAAYLPVRWRLTPTLLDEVRNLHFQKPYLLITVRREQTVHHFEETTTEWQETGRWIVPLDSEMAYISFRAPGRNQVLTTVINLMYQTAQKHAADWIKPKDLDDGPLYDQGGAPKTKLRGGVSYIDTHTTREVIVDRQMFAAEPVRWQKWLVGRFFEGRPHDECHFRRRLISSLFIALVLTVLGIPVRLITMAAYLLGGMRNIDWAWLKPFDVDATPRTRKGRGSIWLHDRYGDNRPWYFWVLGPVTLVGGPFATWTFINFMLREHHGESSNKYRIVTWDLLHTILYVDGVFVGLALVGFVLMGISWLIDTIRKSGQPATNGALMPRVNPEEAARIKMLAGLEEMIGGNGMQASVNALPMSKRTLYLRLSELKGYVCKPFSK